LLRGKEKNDSIGTIQQTKNDAFKGKTAIGNADDELMTTSRRSRRMIRIPDHSRFLTFTMVKHGKSESFQI
jgi:hypothetical protein